MRKIARYGWIKDLGDARDKLLMAVNPTIVTPDQIDQRAMLAPIFDQSTAGSCTGNAWSANYEHVLQKDGFHVFRPSRLQIYYDERVLNGTQDYDSGAQIRDGAKVLAKIGTCPEWMWPYDLSKVTVKPTDACYREAEKHQSIVYMRVPQTQRDIEQCMADGYLITFGFTVYDSFESDAVARTGLMPMPNLNRESVVGGHAVDIVGYDKTKRLAIVRNSWGTGWGDKGYFYMPYEFLLNHDMCSDFWTLRKVEG